jgi:hypothetical protein
MKGLRQSSSFSDMSTLRGGVLSFDHLEVVLDYRDPKA